MSAVVRVDSDVFHGLAFRADVVVLLGYVGELLDAIKTTRPIRSPSIPKITTK